MVSDTVNTVFILGAGASAMAGVPMMRDFLDTARHLQRVGRVGSHGASFDLVFDALSRLQQVHSKAQFDFQNIETVFSAFEFARVIKTFCGYDIAQISQLSEAAKALIAHTVEETLEFPKSPDGPGAPEPYGKFAELISRLMLDCSPKHAVTVITFNYDFALDFAFRGFPYVNLGLTGNRLHAGEVTLLKLHGSINWAACSQCHQILPIKLNDLGYTKTDFAQTDHFRFGNWLRTLSHCNHVVPAQPVLIPPTWNKGSYHEQLSVVWAYAAAALATADNIVVIGYSLPETDLFFRQLYALGTVGARLLERFWVFDPDTKNTVKPRFQALLGPGAQQRFRFFDKPFDAAINILSQAFLNASL